MSYLDIKAFIVVFLLLVIAAGYFFLRRRVGQELLVAILFSLFITSYVKYVYEGINIMIGTINIFPFVAWTAGLIVLREVYERVTIRYKFFVISLIYIATLFLLEYIGYYLLGIRLTWEYESLFGIGIIHGPFVMHSFYLLAGPTYLLAMDYLKT